MLHFFLGGGGKNQGACACLREEEKEVQKEYIHYSK